MMFRENPAKGLRGSSVRVMATEVLTGPESSRVCGDGMDGRTWLLVMALSGVVVSFMRCFNVSFSEIQKSKSLNRRRKVFQSLKASQIFSASGGAPHPLDVSVNSETMLRGDRTCKPALRSVMEQACNPDSMKLIRASKVG